MSGIPTRNKKLDLASAPTPQNTPASNAPISSRAQAPGLSSLKEEDVDRVTAASLLAQHPALVGMIQNKLSGLVGQSSGYIESLPAPVRRRVAGLKGVQKEHSKLEAQFQEEVMELEKKYLTKFMPLYQKRSAIVNGKAEPTDEEVAEGEEDEEDEEDEDEKPKAVNDSEKDDKDDAPVDGVPEFWLSAMKNNPSLAELIMEWDEGALKELTDITMEYLEKPGFRLTFEFAANDYFSNKSLSKTYYYQEETGYGGDFIYDHADGDEILWKANKDLTVKIETKKQRNKNTKQTRIVKKSVPQESFFNFFTPPKPPQEDESAGTDVEDRLELDYSLGEEIKEKLIPRAIDWFTGEALQFEALEEEDLEEGEFEDEDDDDLSDDRDDDDEDDSEEEVDGPRSAKQDESECKNQ